MKATAESDNRFLIGGGEMSELIRSMDWDNTPLGNIKNWPASLRTSLGIILHSAFPMFFFWGDEHICFYNDAFRPSLGIDGKHPAIGKKGKEVWPEIWDFIGPLIDEVMTTAKPVSFNDQLVSFYRNGRMEDIYWTFCYSAAYDDDGNVNGVVVTCTETTDTVLTKRELKESERRLRSMILEAPVSIGIFKGNNYVTEIANSCALELWGRQSEEVLNKPILDAMPELKTQGIKELLDEVYNTGKAFRASELPVQITRDGKLETAYINFSYEPRYNANAEIDGIMGVGIEVTDQVMARKKIEESEEKYKELIRGLPAAVYTCNADGYVQLFNESAVKLWGKTPEAGKDLWCGSWKIFNADGSPLPLENAPMAVALKGGPILNPELIVERPDGSRRNIIPHPQPLYDGEGKIRGAINTIIDITEQVTVLQVIKESEMRFSMLADSIPNLAWMAYADGNIFWYNKKWFEYTGTTLAEMQGWGWQSVHDPEELPKVLNKWQASIKTGEPFEMVFPLKGADGKFRQFLTRVLPVLDSENKIYRWFGTNTDISTQIEAEDKIKESEAKFRTLSETIPIMIWTATPDGKKNFFNQYYLDYTGLSFEELISDGMQKIISPADLKEDLRLWQHSLKTGEDFKMEKRIRRHDGTYRWHVSHGIAQKDEQGNIIGWVGSSTEIEEQKKFAEALEQKVKERTYQLHIQNETFKQAEESSMQGSYSFNLTTGKLSYSDNLFRLIGYEPNEFEPSLEEFNKHVHPEDRDFVQKAAEKVLANKTGDEWHYRMNTKTGTLIHIKGTGRVIESGDEKLLVGTLQDVTKEFELNKELQEKEEYRNQIINNASDAVIVINEESIITLWNPKTEEIFGWKAEEVLGVHLADTIIPTQYREAHKAGMKHHLETGEARILNKTLELTALNKEGKEFPISLTISQASQRNNKLFIAFLRDITHEKQNKEELIVKTKQLQKINQKLELQNIELENSNAELASFSYIASHDLQEPLRKIQTFGKRILETEKFSDKTQDYFNRIISAGERMQNLIVSLLDFSRTNTTELIFVPCDLNAIVEESKNDLHERILEKQAIIEHENLPTLNGIHIQIAQLFTNLIDNAIKYSRPEINPHIKITSSVIEGKQIQHPSANKQKKYHAITFADNGIGFEKQYETKIFELFQRLHGKNEYSGTGIGLAIVKKIVINHNGFIIAEGKPNIGSTFTIYLPTS